MGLLLLLLLLLLLFAVFVVVAVVVVVAVAAVVVVVAVVAVGIDGDNRCPCTEETRMRSYSAPLGDPGRMCTGDPNRDVEVKPLRTRAVRRAAVGAVCGW